MEISKELESMAKDRDMDKMTVKELKELLEILPPEEDNKQIIIDSEGTVTIG